MNGPKVMSLNLVLVFFTRVPMALNATVPPVGTAPGNMVVLVAAGRGVNVGVGALGVLVGVLDDVGDGVNVGVGGAPFPIVIASSEKPAVRVGVAVLLPLPPLQLRRIAPKTNNTTGATTSHLSHRDNIKS